MQGKAEWDIFKFFSPLVFFNVDIVLCKKMEVSFLITWDIADGH